MNTQTEETTVPDYVLAKQELEAYYDSLNLTVKHTGGSLVETDDNGWKHRAWQFTFSARNTIILPYKTGTGINETPKASEVLASAARDGFSSFWVNFDGWADEFGYDPDSRKAEAIYRECQSLMGKLQTILSFSQVEALAGFSNRL